MRRIFKLQVLGVALFAAFLVSETASSPPSSRNVFGRLRREAEAQPEPETTMMSSDKMSGSTTPMTMDGSEGEESGDMSGNSETSTIKSGDSGNSNITTGDKVKDAVNSAEGWIKNAGQNIKSSWDKAKDSIKNTASDVKDKAKKGINTVAGKVYNATAADCKAPKPATGALTTVPKNAEIVDSKCMEESNSSAKSSEETTSPATTNAPGYKKMRRRRDIYGMRFPSSSYAQSGATSGTFDNSDSSASSNEYTWSKTSSTTGITSGSANRQHKRHTPEMNIKSPSIPESPSTESSVQNGGSNSRNKREAVTEGSKVDDSSSSTTVASRNRRASVTDSSNSETSSTPNTRNRRASGTDGTTTEGSSTMASRNKRDSGTENSNAQVISSTETSGKRQRRDSDNKSNSTGGQNSDMSASTTENSGGGESGNSGGAKRNRRAPMEGTTTTLPETGSSEAAPSSGSEEDTVWDKSYGKGGSNNSNQTFSITVSLVDPQEEEKHKKSSYHSKSRDYRRSVAYPQRSFQFSPMEDYMEAPLDVEPGVLFPDTSEDNITMVPVSIYPNISSTSSEFMWSPGFHVSEIVIEDPSKFNLVSGGRHQKGHRDGEYNRQYPFGENVVSLDMSGRSIRWGNGEKSWGEGSIYVVGDK